MKKFLLLLTATLSAYTPVLQVEGDGGDYRQGGGIDAWVPIAQKGRNLYFMQGRLWRAKHYQTGAAGLGWRHSPSSDLVVGLNAFIDLTRSDKDRYYVQGSLGGEVFWCNWVARGAGYLADWKKRDVEEFYDPFIDGTLIFADQGAIREAAYPGLSGEIGYSICTWAGAITPYVGGYWFTTGGRKDFVGPQLRVEYESKPFLDGIQLFFGGVYHYDAVEKSQGRGYVGLRIGAPRVCCGSMACYRTGLPVRRELPLVRIERDSEIIPVIGPNGVQLQGLFVNQIAGPTGFGSQTDPMLISDIPIQGQEGDLIFFLNNDGNILSPVTLLMKDFQVFAGFGDGLSTQVPIFGGGFVTVTDLTGAGRATLAPAGDGIEMFNETRLQGFAIGGGSTQVMANSKTGLIIDGMVLDNASNLAVEIEDSPGVITIRNNRISNTGDDAIFINQDIGTSSFSTTLLATNNIIDTSAETGIRFETAIGSLPETIDITITGNQISDTDNDGIRLFLRSDPGVTTTANGTVSQNVITNAGTGSNDDAITLQTRFEEATNPGTATFLFAHNRMTNTGATGINVENSGSGARPANGNTFVTLRNNIDIGSGAASGSASGFEFRRALAGDSDLCVTMEGNSTTNVNGRSVNFQGPGIPDELQVTNLSDLTMNNSLPGTITQTGNVVSTASPCPLPN